MSLVAESELKEIQTLYATAEQSLKTAESISVAGALPQSVINELRYAGQHLLSALNSADNKFVEEKIIDTKEHCRRAIFDAKEISLIFLLKKIEAFQKEYSGEPISDVIHDYYERMSKVQDIQELLRNLKREDYLVTNGYLNDVDQSINYLIDVNKILNLARNEIEIRKLLRIKPIKISWVSLYISIIVAFFTLGALVIAILSLIKN
jgi:hypothetical protein